MRGRDGSGVCVCKKGDVLLVMLERGVNCNGVNCLTSRFPSVYLVSSDIHSYTHARLYMHVYIYNTYTYHTYTHTHTHITYSLSTQGFLAVNVRVISSAFSVTYSRTMLRERYRCEMVFLCTTSISAYVCFTPGS